MWRATYVQALTDEEQTRLGTLLEAGSGAAPPRPLESPSGVLRLGTEDLVVLGGRGRLREALDEVRRWREAGVSAPVIVLTPDPAGLLSLLDLAPIQLLSTLDAEELDRARLQLELQLQQATKLEDLAARTGSQRRGLSHHLDAIETADEILGLRSERSMARSISEAFNLARRHQTPMSCLLVAVDAFAALEAEFGEGFADFVVVQVAHRLRTEMRQTDLLSRYDAGQLLMLSPFTDASGARQLVDRLQRAVLGQRLERDGRSIEVTVSVGVSTWRLDLESSSALVEAAAAALEEARRGGGRGGCHVV